MCTQILTRSCETTAFHLLYPIALHCLFLRKTGMQVNRMRNATTLCAIYVEFDWPRMLETRQRQTKEGMDEHFPAQFLVFSPQFFGWSRSIKFIVAQFYIHILKILSDFLKIKYIELNHLKIEKEYLKMSWAENSPPRKEWALEWNVCSFCLHTNSTLSVVARLVL